jgi:hypothetical protein
LRLENNQHPLLVAQAVNKITDSLIDRSITALFAISFGLSH